MVSAVSGEEGLSLAWTQSFDLVLLDLRLPGRSGIEILKDCGLSSPFCRSIIVSSLPDSPYATLARRAGAIDFVTKSALVQDLGRAVKVCSRGQRDDVGGPTMIARSKNRWYEKQNHDSPGSSLRLGTRARIIARLTCWWCWMARAASARSVHPSRTAGPSSRSTPGYQVLGDASPR